MVDDLDMKIISMLEEDGSLPFTKIARKLRLNESTVRKRVLSLKERGVIKKFTVVVEPAKIGFNTVALVGIDVTPDKLLDIAKRLTEIPETKYVATSTGDHMIMTEIWARDGKELSRIISEKIGAIDGVKKICPAIVLEKMKG
jgi:Lrp/AsnC family transcriptional regulator for asnA, asnC and gidA